MSKVNYKERAIEAVEKLITRYELGDVETLQFFPETCPLCLVYWELKDGLEEPACYGCPSATKEGNPGCTKQKTFEELYDTHQDIEERGWGEWEEARLKKLYLMRLAYWKATLPILKNASKTVFCPSQKAYWGKLYELDERIFEEFKDKLK